MYLYTGKALTNVGSILEDLHLYNPVQPNDDTIRQLSANIKTHALINLCCWMNRVGRTSGSITKQCGMRYTAYS